MENNRKGKGMLEWVIANDRAPAELKHLAEGDGVYSHYWDASKKTNGGLLLAFGKKGRKPGSM